MADRCGVIQFKGKDIIYVDYSNLDSLEELKDRVTKVTEIERGMGAKDILELIDVTGSYADPEMLELLKESALGTVRMVKKAAVVGVSGVKKILLTVVNKFSGLSIEPKDTIDEAKEWLVSD